MATYLWGFIQEIPDKKEREAVEAQILFDHGYNDTEPEIEFRPGVDLSAPPKLVPYNPNWFKSPDDMEPVS